MIENSSQNEKKDSYLNQVHNKLYNIFISKVHITERKNENSIYHWVSGFYRILCY